jgi:UDP:flavonoid glycosyltransferase YjiC (YdhE family)
MSKPQARSTPARRSCRRGPGDVERQAELLGKLPGLYVARVDQLGDLSCPLDRSQAGARLMRLLMTTTRGTGHYGPLLPFADAFRDAGHAVLIAVPESSAPKIRAAGHEAWPLAEADPAERSAVFARSEGAGEDEANRIVVGELMAGVDARASLPGVLDAIAGFRPDVILHESSEFAAVPAAERAGIPVAHVSVGLTSLGEKVIGWVAPAVDALRREHGLAPDPRGERLYDHPTLSLTPPALDGPSPALHYRVPRPAPTPLAHVWDGDEHPLVYLSLGTVAPSTGAYPGLYRAAVDGLAPLPIRLLVSTGGQDPAALGPLPANVRAAPWVDEGAVGHHASAMVTHAGAGSLRAALTAGLPLVAMPLFGDQPHNARALAATGAGIVVEGGPRGLGEAVGAVLEDPSFARRALEIADEIAALPPAGEAIEILRRLDVSSAT